MKSREDQKQEIRLTTPKEFSFSENLNYLARSTNECLFHVKDQKIYKAIPIDSYTPLVKIGAERDQEIMIRFLGGTEPSEQYVRDAVVDYINDWFDLDTDLSPFYDLAKNDPLLNKAVDQFYGLRVIGIPDLFEALCWGIIGQQINLPFAYTLKRRFVENFGRHVECAGEIYWIFPTPQDIATLKVKDLQALQMTERKSQYLIHVARLMVEGRLSKELLINAGSYKAAEKMLTHIRGIGPWTANYVLMRCLRYHSAFPIDDVGLHNAIKYVLDMETKPTKEEILKLSASWNNWESYATFYLWRFLY